MSKLKLRGKLPEGSMDGLTAAAGRLGQGEPVFALMRVEALYVEVSPEGDELAVVAEITEAEAMPQEIAVEAEADLMRLRGKRTGEHPLELEA